MHANVPCSWKSEGTDKHHNLEIHSSTGWLKRALIVLQLNVHWIYYYTETCLPENINNNAYFWNRREMQFNGPQTQHIQKAIYCTLQCPLSAMPINYCWFYEYIQWFSLQMFKVLQAFITKSQYMITVIRNCGIAGAQEPHAHSSK